MAQQEHVNLKKVRDRLRLLRDNISSKEASGSLANQFAVSDPDYNEIEIQSSFEEVKARVKAIDSDLFFIVVFGALKAGKSTLTNLLTNKSEISPTRFGEECTMRPSIIIGAKDGESEGMTQYFRKSAGDSGKLADFALFSDIMAHLRLNEPLNGDCIETVVSGSLDIESIRDALTQKGDSPKEPLITVIRVKDSEILKNKDGVNIALVDMPGLDGKKANSDDPVYKWTQAESDFLIMVQSDFAALSGSIVDYLNDYKREDEAMSPEIWVLLNKMEVTPWRLGEKLKDTENERRRHAENRLIEALTDGKNHGLTFKSDNISSVNLGKASDAYFNPQWIDTAKNPHILEDSGYPEFLNRFSGRIDSRKEILLSISLIGRLKKGLENLIKAFETANANAVAAKDTAIEAANKLLYDGTAGKYDLGHAEELSSGLPAWLVTADSFYPDANSARILFNSYSGVSFEENAKAEESNKTTLYEKLPRILWSDSKLKGNISAAKNDDFKEYLTSIEKELEKQIKAVSGEIREEYDSYDRKISQETENRIRESLNNCGIKSEIKVSKPNDILAIPCNFDKTVKWKERKLKELRKYEVNIGPIKGNENIEKTEAEIHNVCGGDLEKWLKSFAEQVKQHAVDNQAPVVRGACRQAVMDALDAIDKKCAKAGTEIAKNNGHIEKIRDSYIKELDSLLRELNEEKEKVFGNG